MWNMPMGGADETPHPNDPTWPRYATRPFPPYRFVPGKTPHPRRDPRGHSYGEREPELDRLQPDTWAGSDSYRYGIDLYNFAYWWESHEIFEAFWHAAGPKTEQGQFFQALIQLAAANLKQFMGNENAADNLFRSCAKRLSGIPDRYMGLNLAGLRSRLHAGRTGGILLSLK